MPRAGENGRPRRATLDPIVTKGHLGKADGPYAVDTLTAPDDNPQKSFLRFGGLDFFANGDLAVCSVSGDVWVVSGVDEKLDQLEWRRFATGLFQPLGLKVVDDQIYVLGRDQITRLHDLNRDGEADFYENFNNDGLVTTNGHAYVACLERDPAGNFYYIKCGDRTPHGGTILRVSPDGRSSSRSPPACGTRTGWG
jgi:glucose/arabinose dehydrogenase